MSTIRIAMWVAFMVCSTGYSQELDLQLLKAAENGNAAEVEALLRAGANARAEGDDDVTALMKASMQPNTEVVRVLLEAGARVNEDAKDGRTALMVAAESGHYETVIALLLAGANVDAEDEKDRTARTIAETSDHPAIASVLRYVPYYGKRDRNAFLNGLGRYVELLRVVENEYATEVEREELVQASIRSVLRTLDPASNFLPRREGLADREHGPGMLVKRLDGKLTVASLFEASPAYQMGIRSGDIILEIEGEDTRQMELGEAVERLSGPQGSKATVSIALPGYAEPLDFSIVRDEIELLSTVPFAFTLAGNVGYMRLWDFGTTTAAEVDRHLGRMRQKGIDSLILDLRENSGGLLDQVVAVANRFLEKGQLVVSTEVRSDYGSDQEYVTTQASAYSDLPLAVLVSRGTASGAEILAGAIQDHERGLIVGEKTFGSGTIQSIYRISGGNGLALTTAKYLTPSGRSIGGLGIEPDLHVPTPALPRPLRYLLSVQALSRFAVGFAPEGGRRPASPMTASEPVPRHVRLINPSFEVGEETLDEFFDFLEQEGVDFAKEQLLEHRDSLATLMKREIFSSSWGVEAGVRATIDEDPQVQRALEALTGAGNLSDVNR